MTTTAPPPTGTSPAAESAGRAGAAPALTEPEAAHRIAVLREQIDAVDDAIIRLVNERTSLSRNVGALRSAAGGPRLSLSRENQILGKFAAALGGNGTPLAMLLLKISRGRM